MSQFEAKGYTFVKLLESNFTDITFQEQATTTGNGKPFSIFGFKTITLEITGTSTSRTVVFEGCSKSGTFYPIQGVRLSDLEMASQTTGNGEVWQFDVTGLIAFRTRIAAVDGGYVTVQGQAVA